ncbi:MAG TPA: hypothetical protein VF006_06645 [Longimicrobium sp.]
MQGYLDQIRKTVSRDRFDAYRRSGDRDDFDVLARYLWNAMLCEALYPAMQAFEVALRNTLYRAIESAYPAAEADCEDVASWLDLKVPILHPKEAYRVPDAKSELARRGKQLTVGRLIAELNLNFWRKLLHRPYGARAAGASGNFWPRLIPAAFPAVDRRSNNIARISEAVDEIYVMRNRMFHHEPIFDRVLQKHGTLLRVIRWIEPELEVTIREFDRFPETFSLQPEGLRDRLERVAHAGHDARAHSAARENLVKGARRVLGAAWDATDAGAHDVRELANALPGLAARPVPSGWVLRSMRDRLASFVENARSDAAITVAASGLADAIARYLALDRAPDPAGPPAVGS